MSMAIFAASNFASLFFAKRGCVAYERRMPSGLVMVKMHCLSVIGVRGRCRHREELTPRTGLLNKLELEGVRASKCTLTCLMELRDCIALDKLACRGGRCGAVAVEIVLEGDGADVGQVSGDAVEGRVQHVDPEEGVQPERLVTCV